VCGKFSSLGLTRSFTAGSASGADAAPFEGLFTITENGVIWNAGRAPSAHHERSSDGVVHPEWPIHLPDAVVKPYDLAKVDHMAAHDCRYRVSN